MSVDERSRELPVGVNYRPARIREDTTGEIKGVQLNRQFGTSQLAVGAAVLMVGLVSEPLWGLVMPSVVGIVLTIAAALGAAALSAFLMIQGRTPVQVMRGIVNAMLAPASGCVDGAAVRWRRAAVGGGRYWVGRSR